MAYLKQCWFSERGEACSSEGDALMADAADRIESHLMLTCTIRDREEFARYLAENSGSILPLLVAYRDAKAVREREIGTPL